MVKTRSETKKLKQTSDHQSTQPRPEVLVGSNDDLLTEILLRLPAASILRFKSVSKHWRWLLSQRDFTHRYDNNKLSESPGIFVGDRYIPFDVEDRCTPPYICLDLYFDSHVEIVQSCNGLLLCCSGQGSGSPKYYVFNPTTKQLAIIPEVPGGQKVQGTICFMGMAFHQSDSVHYKLVCICALRYAWDLIQILIYSSETKKWKTSIESISGIKPLYGYIHIFNNPVFLNGAVHWVSAYEDYLYFNVDDEQLQTLHLPEEFKSSKVFIIYLGESRGHLHLIADHRALFVSFRANVYEMLSDHSGWFLKYQLALDVIPVALPEVILPNGYNVQVVDVVRGEEEKDTFVVLKTRQNIITYNVHDKSFKQIYCCTDGDLSMVSSVYRYTETLSSF